MYPSECTEADVGQ